MISREEIFNHISTAIRAEFGADTFVVSERVNVPAKLPCVWVLDINWTPEMRFTNFELDDEQYRSTYEVQAFSNLQVGATAQAKSLVACAEKAFRQLGYRMSFNEPVDNPEDTSIKRQVARFTRFVGGADTINISDSNT